MKEIKVPELAESITEGTIAEWLVGEGDKVEKGDPVLELETDKVNVEVNADTGGVITELLKGEGDDVEVGDAIAKVDETGEASGDSGSDSGSSEEDTSKQEKEESDQEEKQESKEESEQEEKKEQKEQPKEDDSSGDDKKKEDVIATPAARKRARELGIDLSEISARDPYGRVRPEDVDEHAKGGSKKEEKQSSKSSSDKKEKEESKEEFDKPVEREKMSRRRQTIAKRLVEVQQESAMLTTFNEVDMTNVMKLRKERKEAFQDKHGVKLGFMSFFTKAAVGALKEFPLLNAEIQGKEVVKKKFYDIGMAVSTDEGLVVPVVRDADRIGFAGIESEIIRLAERARNKELGLEDLQGGSFTITNGGIFGSMLSTPILNSPQVGILGLHNIEKRPKVMPDDSIEARPMMYIALSYDHRIVDGKEAVQFLRRIKEMIEDPYDLLLEG